MFEITPSLRPPLATLLAATLPFLVLAGLLLSSASPRERRRVVVGALVLGGCLTAASALLWSRRHAGTGLETARGWPRVVHARWVPLDDGATRAGLHWRGVAESGVAYAAGSAMLLALGSRLARRRQTVHTGGPSVPS
jgi:hypothetical protein